jgi:hypothetical protein
MVPVPTLPRRYCLLRFSTLMVVDKVKVEVEAMVKVKGSVTNGFN